jgi:hypothetical protein
LGSRELGWVADLVAKHEGLGAKLGAIRGMAAHLEPRAQVLRQRHIARLPVFVIAAGRLETASDAPDFEPGRGAPSRGPRGRAPGANLAAVRVLARLRHSYNSGATNP